MNVGVTGHQRLGDPTAWAWVERAARRQLQAATGPLVLVTCLAVGTDQLVARLALERGGSLYAVLPFADVERTFGAAELRAYRHLVSQAVVEILQTPGTDEDAYLAAGQRVVDLSGLVIAVWDGKPAKGKGGTADIVNYAVDSGVPVVQIDPVDRGVKRLQ